MIMTKDERKVRVDIDKLKIGDTVYVPWNRDCKYPYWKKEIIEKISPKKQSIKTNFLLRKNNNCGFSFFEYHPSMDIENSICEAQCEIKKFQNYIYKFSLNLCNTFDDDKIVEIADKMLELEELIESAKKRT